MECFINANLHLVLSFIKISRLYVETFDLVTLYYHLACRRDVKPARFSNIHVENIRFKLELIYWRTTAPLYFAKTETVFESLLALCGVISFHCYKGKLHFIRSCMSAIIQPSLMSPVYDL